MDDALEPDHGKQPAGKSAQPGQHQHRKRNQAGVAGRFPVVNLGRPIHVFFFSPPTPPEQIVNPHKTPSFLAGNTLSMLLYPIARPHFHSSIVTGTGALAFCSQTLATGELHHGSSSSKRECKPPTTTTTMMTRMLTAKTNAQGATLDDVLRARKKDMAVSNLGGLGYKGANLEFHDVEKLGPKN